MSQDELDALAAEHGGVSGKVYQGPTTEPDPDVPVGGVTRPIPDYKRPQRINFKDGSYITIKPNLDEAGTAVTADDDGNEFTVVNPLVVKKPAAGSDPNAAPTTRLDGAGNLLQWNKQSHEWESVDSSGGKSSPEETAARIAKAVQDKREREYNSTHPDADGNAYYATHAEVAALKSDGTARGLTAAQIKLANDRIGQDNKRLDATIRIDEAKGKLDSAREDRLTNAAVLSAQAQKAASDLNTQKLAWDKEVHADTMTAEAAKFKYEQAWNAVQAAATAARLAHDDAVEQNRVDDSKRDDDTLRRGQDNDAARNTETSTNNANVERQNSYDSALDAGKAGGQLAADMLPFMAPHGTSEYLSAINDGMLKDPMHPATPPPVPSVPFPWDPTTLVHDLTARSLQQQSAYAADFVRNAGPNRPVNDAKPMIAPAAPGAPPTAPPQQATAPAQAPPATQVGNPTDQQVEQYAEAHKGEPGMNWEVARQQMTSVSAPPAAAAPPAAPPAAPKADPTIGNDRRNAGPSTKAPATVINLHFNAPTGSSGQPQLQQQGAL